MDLSFFRASSITELKKNLPTGISSRNGSIRSILHLVGLASRCGVTVSTVSFGSSLLPFGLDEMLVSGNIFFYNGGSSIKSSLLQTLEYNQRGS